MNRNISRTAWPITAIHSLAFLKALSHENKLYFFCSCPLMKDYELNAFGHVLNLVGNTRNKSASFFCLDMQTKPLFMFFHFTKFGLQDLQKYSSKSLWIYLWQQERNTEQMCQVSFK